jgi:hypothetical protein
MASAFERGLIDPFVTGYQLEISVDKINEAKQSATPLKTLSQNIGGVGKPGANAKQMAEFFSKMVPKYVESTVEFLQAVRSVMKICSFSAVSDSILMWSHYGSNHQGFCIEYDLEKFDPDDAFLRNLYPVTYSHQLFDLTPWAEKLVTGKIEGLTPFSFYWEFFRSWTVGHTRKSGDTFHFKRSRPRTVPAQCPFPAEFSWVQKHHPQLHRGCWRFVRRGTLRCDGCVCPTTNTSCSRNDAQFDRATLARVGACRYPPLPIPIMWVIFDPLRCPPQRQVKRHFSG